VAPRVYIDGHVGTTGLRIREWLDGRKDLELLTPDEARRKDPEQRRELLESADLAVLCLPDDAAREAASWLEGSDTRILDASNAHRVVDGWVYGLPEIAPEQREAIAAAPRVSNPGCYPTPVILAIRPLVEAGLLADDLPLSIHALSGYSGGGRSMIEKWEDPEQGLPSLPYEAPYALDSRHKHLPEMQRFARLTREPQFTPAVGAFRCGMRVQIPLHREFLCAGATGKALWEVLDERYRDEAYVRVIPIAEPLASHERSFDPQACNDTNRLELRVLPHPSGHVLLMGTLDNLGKGAAGAAIQNLNLMLGVGETEGLDA
jgi:N-acetyl-gamma-glutamyl-phosphate reductase